MKRWSFVSGLTVIFLLLIATSGFSVWVIRGMTVDLERMIADNYDTISSVRTLRAAVTRLNIRSLSNQWPPQIPRGRGAFELDEAEIRRSLAAIRHGVLQEAEPSDVSALATLVEEHISNCRQLFTLATNGNSALNDLTEVLAEGTEDIANVSQRIVAANEAAIFARRDAAVERGRRFGWLSLAIAGFSLGIYIWTSVRLTRSVFVPLRQLRDSIVKVGQRQFDVVVSFDGGDELAQIASTFNRMAAELRTFVEETDHRVVEANRVSRAILDALPYPIYIVDDDFRVKLKNPRAVAINAALKISGQVPAVVRKCIDQAAALGTELLGDDLHRAVEIPVPEVGPGLRPTYLPQVFRMAATPGLTAGWAVLLVDVTKLRQFDLAKTKAISTLGHEVKTPVTTIRMTLHLLLEEKIGPLTADQRELITAGRDDCERLLDVLQALLELARFEGGRVEQTLRPTPPGELLAQAAAMHGGVFRSADGPLEVQPVASALPPVLADSMHVVRVLGNFLSNANKYRSAGTPVVMLATDRADGFVRLTVRNQTDRPLSEAEQLRVFDPFYRRAGEGAEGTGLGLTICREIAASHHGRIGVWSEGGVVEFFLDLRIAPIVGTDGGVPVPRISPP